MRRAAWCLVFATRVASADDDMRESAIAADEIRLVGRDELGLRYKLDVVAAGLSRTESDARREGGAAAATAHVGITTSGRCELVGIGGMASARTDEEVLAMSQWASVCLAWDASGYTSLDHRLDWDLTPRLLATPRFRTGPQRRETIGWDFVGTTIRIREDEPSEEYEEHLQQGWLRVQTAVGWIDGDPRYDVDVGMNVLLRTYIRT